MDIHIIVFDFDGTLVDSNQVKHQVFHELFPATPDAQACVAAVLREHPESHRAITIRAILDRLEPAADARRLEALVETYGRLVLERVAAAPAMPGAHEALVNLSTRFPLYLNSATPQEPLQELVRRRGWTGYFTGLYGYPNRKADVLRGILAARHAVPNQMLMVGDGRADAAAAAAVGCRLFLTGRDGTLHDLLKHPMVAADT